MSPDRIADGRGVMASSSTADPSGLVTCCDGHHPWRDTEDIVVSFADTVFARLKPAVLCVQYRTHTERPCVKIRQAPHANTQLRKQIGDLIRTFTADRGDLARWEKSSRLAVWSGTLGRDAEHGRVVVGSDVPGFPNEYERALLEIGTSQLARAVHERALFLKGRQEFERREHAERARRVVAEEALHEVDQRFRLAFEHSPIGMALAAPSGPLLEVNRAFCELLGYEQEELCRLTFQAITHPDDLESDLTLVSRLLDAECDRYTLEKRYLHKHGHSVWALLDVSLLRDARGKPLYFIGQVRDVTEQKRFDEDRKRLMTDMRTLRERSKRLSWRLVRIQEEERQSVARELHDEVGQLLTGLKLVLEMRERRGTSLDAQLRDIAGQLLERVQDLSLNLRPPMLDQHGLDAALRGHFGRYRAQTGTEVVFHSSLVGTRFAPETEITAFRIIQEGLTNVARHAGVRSVTVGLWLDGNRLRLRIEDEGRGFDASTLEAATSGLSGMRERAALAGGSLQVDSRPGRGTVICAELPRTRPAEASC